MGFKRDEFLNLLLWTTDIFVRPSFLNLTDTYEGWAYRNRLMKQLPVLEKGRLIERNTMSAGDRMYRLTAHGRLQALGGRDPEDRWTRDWDGHWRLVLFDVPTRANAQRERLRRYLRARGFGCLQKSVWITPDPVEEERQALDGGKIDVASLIFLEAQPCAGESDMEIVSGAWDFEKINRRYAEYLKVLQHRPDRSARSDGKTLFRWLSVEREAWLDAIGNDPLLPDRLLPPDYSGRDAWRRRQEALRVIGRQFNA